MPLCRPFDETTIGSTSGLSLVYIGLHSVYIEKMTNENEKYNLHHPQVYVAASLQLNNDKEFNMIDVSTQEKKNKRKLISILFK